MLINQKLKGFATNWLIIVGLLLIIGSAYWFWVDDVKPYLDRRYIGADDLKIAPENYWKTYRNENLGFEVKYPSGWHVSNPIYAPNSNSIFGLIFQSSDFKNNIHGIGLPGLNNMWFEVYRGACNEPSEDFIAESKPDIFVKTVCQNDFQLTFGLWQEDSELILHKEILNKILSTFKFIK